MDKMIVLYNSVNMETGEQCCRKVTFHKKDDYDYAVTDSWVEVAENGEVVLLVPRENIISIEFTKE